LTESPVSVRRDIVARGRRLARQAVALMLLPHLFIPINAFLAKDVLTGGGETARLVVWIGFLYLVYRGFRFVRWITLLYATVLVILAIVSLIRNAGHNEVAWVLFNALLVTSFSTGVALLLFSPTLRAYLTYQLGGAAPDTNISETPRSLTSA